MIESLNTIYAGLATVIKNKEYLSTKAYIEPFVERMLEYKASFICQVKPAEQISYDEKSINYIYNRVLITAILPDNKITIFNNKDIKEYHRVLCMAYALDVKTPICKFYTGVIDNDNNFYSFGANCFDIQEIEPNTALNYIPITKILSTGLNDNCEIILNQNINRYISKNDMLKTLGKWIDFSIKKEYVNDSGKVKLSNTLPIETYKELMINKDSDWYTEGDIIMYPKILQSLLYQITKDDKDIINRYEKTQLINQMLEL